MTYTSGDRSYNVMTYMTWDTSYNMAFINYTLTRFKTISEHVLYEFIYFYGMGMTEVNQPVFL